MFIGSIIAVVKADFCFSRLLCLFVSVENGFSNGKS